MDSVALMPTRFAPDLIEQALASVSPGAWSLPSTYASTRVHHGYRRIVLVSAGSPVAEAAAFETVLQAFDPVEEAWLSWIDPGGFIVPHQDGGPWWERWQVPLRPAGRHLTACIGVPFQVAHWAPHEVINDTDRPRIHLVIDRAIRVDRPPTPFTIYKEPHNG